MARLQILLLAVYVSLSMMATGVSAQQTLNCTSNDQFDCGKCKTFNYTTTKDSITITCTECSSGSPSSDSKTFNSGTTKADISGLCKTSILAWVLGIAGGLAALGSGIGTFCYFKKKAEKARQLAASQAQSSKKKYQDESSMISQGNFNNSQMAQSAYNHNPQYRNAVDQGNSYNQQYQDYNQSQYNPSNYENSQQTHQEPWQQGNQNNHPSQGNHPRNNAQNSQGWAGQQAGWDGQSHQQQQPMY